MSRISHENLALARFRELAEANGFKVFSGQGAGNRIVIDGGVYYQFGDLRVELPDCTLIIEVESSGGVTNLAKYWECYEFGRLVKPLKLLHLFRQISANDYKSHMVAWRFLCDRMHAELGDRFEGHLLTYQDGQQSSLEPALSIFADWLARKAANSGMP